MVVTAVPDSMSSDSSRSCVLAGVGGVFRDKLNENHTHIYMFHTTHTDAQAAFLSGYILETRLRNTASNPFVEYSHPCTTNTPTHPLKHYVILAPMHQI